MKSIRLTKARRSNILNNATTAIEAKYPLSDNTKEALYKRLVIKDIEARMVPIMEAAELHGLTKDINFASYTSHLAHGMLKPDEIEGGVPSNILGDYIYEGKFHKDFNTKYELVYQPMVEQAEAENQEILAQQIERVKVLKKLLNKCNTSGQLEAIWKEAPDYYTSEMKQEIGQ